MLELWDLIAVVGKTIQFINYRTKKIVNEIKIISKETTKNEVAIPLFAKINSNQTEMIVVLNGGGLFFINLVTFQYRYISNDDFFSYDNDSSNQMGLNIFKNLKLHMEEEIKEELGKIDDNDNDSNSDENKSEDNTEINNEKINLEIKFF